MLLDLHEPIDVYSEWIDECEEANKQNLQEEEEDVNYGEERVEDEEVGDQDYGENESDEEQTYA